MTSRMESLPDSRAQIRSQPNAIPPCGGGPERERVEEEAELLLRLLLGEAQIVEHPLLDVAAVDTDRPATDLVAVADDVVGVRQRRARVLVEGVEQLRLGRREGMVHGSPGARADGDVTRPPRPSLEHRGVDDPQERPRRLVDQPAASADLAAGRAEQRLRRCDRAPAAKNTQSPGLGADVPRPARRARLGRGSWPPGRPARRPRRPGRTPARARRAAWPSPATRRAACAAGEPPPGITTAPT